MSSVIDVTTINHIAQNYSYEIWKKKIEVLAIEWYSGGAPLFPRKIPLMWLEECVNHKYA